MVARVTFNDLLAQETKRNPHAFYARLREQGPLFPIDNFDGMGGGWIVTTYEDALTILKDPRLFKDTQKIFASRDESASGEEVSAMQWFFTQRRDMLTVDPPDHTRLRGLVSKVFTPRMIERLRPRIQQIADDLLDAVEGKGQMDLITDFAYLLPINVISDMLGIPRKDRLQFRTWTQVLVNAPEDPQAQIAAGEEFFRYIRALLAEKQQQPGDDLISDLLQAEECGDILDEKELVSTIFLLIGAGHETTTNLIGNGILELLQHPEQLRTLRSDPSYIPGAVEELLRYTAPVSLTSYRWASEDIPFHDIVIRKGEIVLISLSAANTDTQEFLHPELLDVTRRVNKHLAFGKGIHVCLGAPLARLEGQIALATLLKRLPNLRLAEASEDLLWNRTFSLRGLTSLPVTF